MAEPFDVSVLVPVWNGAPYLAEALESALNQSRPPREIIVVDNGSTDDTPKIIERYAGRVRAYRNESNIGAVPNWQMAASLAASEYLTWLPADDWLAPDCLAAAATILAAHPEVGWYFSGFEVIDTAHGVLSRSQLEQLGQTGLVDRSGLIDHMIACGQPNMVAGSMVRRDFFEQLGGFDMGLRGACDYDLFMRLTGHAPVYANPSVLVKIRSHPNQGSTAIIHRDNGDPDRFFAKAGDFDFLSEAQLRNFVEGLCEYARQYYHRPLRQANLSPRELYRHRQQVRQRLIGWRDSGQPYAKYVRLTPRKPLAAFAWIAGATVPGTWLAGQATRWLSPRTIGDPSRIRVDLASEPPK